MFPIDIKVLNELAAQVPILQSLPPSAQNLVFVGLAVQGIIGGARKVITNKTTAEEQPAHWFNRFIGRNGPLVNVALGFGLGYGTTIGWHLGLLGGALSSWSFAFLNKFLLPSLKATLEKFKPKEA